MEINFWLLVVTVLVALAILAVVVVVSREKAERKRIAAQERQDDSTILNIYNNIRSSDIRTYKDLPNRKGRREWLRSIHPEFMEAVERRHYASNVDGIIASNLDVRLIQDTASERSTAVRVLLNTAIAMSLNEYQQIRTKQNAEHRRLEEIRMKEQAKRKAEAELARKAAEKSARAYWKSLSREQRAAFKNAKGKTARRNSLPATSSDFSVDVLYPLIMAVQFGDINPNSNQSIDYSESSSHSSGGYSDSGSSSYGSSSSYDSGSSYSSSDSGSSSSSSDGGGGGGGGGE